MEQSGRLQFVHVCCRCNANLTSIWPVEKKPHWSLIQMLPPVQQEDEPHTFSFGQLRQGA